MLLAILLPGLLMAEVWPENIGAWKRTGVNSAPAPQPKALWDEYGLQETAAASYEQASKKFTATAWRLLDSTAGLAVFDWQRPEKATPSKVAPLAVETPNGLLAAHGNYVLAFEGYKPTKEELDALLGGLRNVDTTSLPALPGYLPSDDLVPNSERYITGPVGLETFVPGISPSAAGFHMGVEARSGVFRSGKGTMTMAIFDYPTQQIAMQKIGFFQQIPGAVAKRSGPLVAVILSPSDPDAAEHLLAKVRYQASVTLSEYVPTRRDNVGDLILNIFVLIGVLLALAVTSGLFFGGFRAFFRFRRKGEEPEAMIRLHLEGR